ncbi:MAG: DNA-protecting protein DprA [Nitrospinae bacterium]|nr:DNA-protecting protein DprA [Nitrospinota bacterium]
MIDNTLATVALNTVPFLFPVHYHRLVEWFGAPAAVLKATEAQLSALDGISPSLARQIALLDGEREAMAEFGYADKIGAAIHTLDDPSYPARLKEIFAPPPVLSVIGTLPDAEDPAMAVVGTRAATLYGKTVATRIVEELVAAGVVIVSGLARGIDRTAHEACIGAGGRTVAALGNGLNVFYPPENRKLQIAIAETGAVVSQFPFNAKPEKTSFPLRNRVVSGLSHGALVVEAEEKSGALITASAALEEGREVFALPGPVNAKKSDGPNLLIQKGYAKLVRNGADILAELPDFVQARLKKPGAGGAQIPLPETTPEERLALSILDGTPIHLDEVAIRAGLPTPMASAILLTLELKGLVRQAPGNLFLRA